MNWGDGTAALFMYLVSTQGSLGTQAHTFAEEGAYTVTVSVADNVGDSSQTTFQVVVADAPLTAGTLTPPTATEGAAITNAVLFNFTDADPHGTATDYTATVTWGDGSVETSADDPADVQVVARSDGGFEVVGSHTYAEEAKGLTFSVSVADVGGAAPVGSSDTTFSVADAPLTVGDLTPPMATEGQPITNAVYLHFTDADPKGTASDYTATFNWGDGTVETSAANPSDVQIVADGNGFDVVGSHTYTEEAIQLQLSITVTDDGGATATARIVGYYVNDAPLTAGALTPPSATEGQPITKALLFHFTDADPNGTAGDYTATVTWGDGTVENSADDPADVQVVAHSGGGFDVFGSHTYAEEATGLTFGVSVTDDVIGGIAAMSLVGTAPATASDATFSVADAPLTAGALTPPTAIEGSAVTSVVLFHFTDANINAKSSDFTATVTWGDGAVETSSANPADVQVVAHSGGGFDVIGSHTYAEETSGKTFSVSVADVGGAAPVSASDTAFSVADAPLTAGALTPPSATQGQAFTKAVLFHFTDADPNSTASDYNATVTWGDGSVETSSANPTDVHVVADGGGFDVVGSHTYVTEVRGLTFSVSVVDAGGAHSVGASATINVAAVDVIYGRPQRRRLINGVRPVGRFTSFVAGRNHSRPSAPFWTSTDRPIFLPSPRDSEGAQYDNTLWEYASGGWSQQSSGSFAQISPALDANGESIVYGLLTNGSLWEQGHTRGLNADWGELSSNNTIQYISAVTDAAGDSHLYVIDSVHVTGYAFTLWEHSSVGWRQDSSGQFSSVSAGLNSAGQAVVYGIVTNGTLWEQNPAFGPIGLDRGWQELSGSNGMPMVFTSAQAGGPDKVFAIAQDSTIWEHTPTANTHFSPLIKAMEISATETPSGADEVFSTRINDTLYAYSSAFTGSFPYEQILAGGVASNATPE